MKAQKTIKRIEVTLKGFPNHFKKTGPSPESYFKDADLLGPNKPRNNLATEVSFYS